MHRWLLAATAFTLGVGFMICRASESAAQQPQMETHSQALTVSTVESSVYFPLRPGWSGIAPDAEMADFRKQIESWIATLSGQDDFRDWPGAEWTRYPLGAGMHGWLVLLHKNGQEIGYLVVGATEDGKLTLTEYGSGEHPLFSLQTLHRSLAQAARNDPDPDKTAYTPPLPVERLYFSPLHAVWKVARGNDSIYIDAKTGEQLPLSAESFESLQPYRPASPILKTEPHISRSLLLQPFDPFDNTYWIVDEPQAVATSAELLTLLERAGPPVTFKSNLYGNTVLAPFAVTGLQLWTSDAAYVRLEQAGVRYVPFDVLAEYGAFHRQREDMSF